MSAALSSSVGIVAYLALFAGVGLLFVFAALLVGRFARPANPFPEKQETYECGEPAIGTSFVQFDLRFYVVALLFIVFDVEVAFFFPWATVFGKSTRLMDPRMQVVATENGSLTPSAKHLYRELGVRSPEVPVEIPKSLRTKINEDMAATARSEAIVHKGARQLALFTIVDILVFFAVLMVGFAYVWKRGDLDWVRAVGRQRARGNGDRASGADLAREPVLSA
ncbi:MAG: NADH-quinone oxidoreductase subunit A [Pirellulaceae bacterium]